MTTPDDHRFRNAEHWVTRESVRDRKAPPPLGGCLPAIGRLEKKIPMLPLPPDLPKLTFHRLRAL